MTNTTQQRKITKLISLLTLLLIPTPAITQYTSLANFQTFRKYIEFTENDKNIEKANGWLITPNQQGSLMMFSNERFKIDKSESVESFYLYKTPTSGSPPFALTSTDRKKITLSGGTELSEVKSIIMATFIDERKILLLHRDSTAAAKIKLFDIAADLTATRDTSFTEINTGITAEAIAGRSFRDGMAVLSLGSKIYFFQDGSTIEHKEFNFFSSNFKFVYALFLNKANIQDTNLYGSSSGSEMVIVDYTIDPANLGSQARFILSNENTTPYFEFNTLHNTRAFTGGILENAYYYDMAAENPKLIGKWETTYNAASERMASIAQTDYFMTMRHDSNDDLTASSYLFLLDTTEITEDSSAAEIPAFQLNDEIKALEPTLTDPEVFFFSPLGQVSNNFVFSIWHKSGGSSQRNKAFPISFSIGNKICHSKCGDCVEGSKEDSCLTCKDGKSILNPPGKCSCDSSCGECSQYNDELSCTSCKEKSLLNPPGKCECHSSCSDCSQYGGEENSCLVCSDGKAVVNGPGMCQCHSSCLKCEVYGGGTDSCTSCGEGFRLAKEVGSTSGTCVEDPTGLGNLTEKIPSAVCNNNEILGCLICSETDPNYCKACVFGAGLEGKVADLGGVRCVACPIEECGECELKEGEQERKCTKCKSGKTLKEDSNGTQICYKELVKLGALFVAIWVGLVKD